MARARTNRSPALFASAVAHAGIIAATLIAWPWLMKPMDLGGKVVPVTLVTSGPPADLAPAVKAPEPQPAVAPAPTPPAPPQPAPVSAAPPTPPAPAPASKPNPPAKPAPAKAAANPDDFFTSLSKSLQANTKQPPSTPSTSGKQGQTKPNTAPTDQQGQGTDTKVSQSEIDGLKGKIGRYWNPNCQVEGAQDVELVVHIRLTPQGYLAGPPELKDQAKIQASGNAVLIASAQRMLAAVGRAQPYTDVLRPEHYATWSDMNLHFHSKDACR